MEKAMRSWGDSSETRSTQEANKSYHQRTEIHLVLLFQVIVQQTYEPEISCRPLDWRGVPAKYPG